MSFEVNQLEDLKTVMREPETIDEVYIDLDGEEFQVAADYLVRTQNRYGFDLYSEQNIDNLRQERQKTKNEVFRELEEFYDSIPFQEEISSFMIKGSLSHKENFQPGWSDVDLLFTVEDGVDFTRFLRETDYKPNFSPTRDRINSINLINDTQIQNDVERGVNCRKEYDMMQIKRYARLVEGENELAEIEPEIPEFMPIYQEALGRLQSIRKSSQKLLKEQSGSSLKSLTASTIKSSFIMSKRFVNLHEPGKVLGYYEDLESGFRRNYDDQLADKLLDLIHFKETWPVASQDPEALKEANMKALELAQETHDVVAEDIERMMKDFEKPEEFEFTAYPSNNSNF